MTAWQPRLDLERELQQAEERLRAAPDDVELRFYRAVTLAQMGQSEEAKAAYLALLALAPSHFGALNNLGALLLAMGFSTAARTCYLEAIRHHPDNPTAHINLANAFAGNNDTQAALKHFTIALSLAPEHAQAHQGLAHLLTDMGDEENAKTHRVKGFKDQPILLLPYRGNSVPVPLLVLASTCGGTVPIRQHIDDKVFFTSVLFVDFYDPAFPFPPHQLVFNAIGDADNSTASLKAAIDILKRSEAPVINPPSKILATGRADNAKRFAHIPGVIVPKMLLLPRASLENGDVATLIAEHGFSFPVLLRAPGFHNGRFFIRCDSMEALTAALPSLPGQELMLIQYFDARSADGKIRKYRVMRIKKTLYPLHAALSHDWKIHYFSADMAGNPENRAEDAAFLENMPAVLGARAMAALENIFNLLDLDYAGADFSLSPQGEVMLFEANATMTVNTPDADARWDYRRPAVLRITNAIRNLLTHYAS